MLPASVIQMVLNTLNHLSPAFLLSSKVGKILYRSFSLSLSETSCQFQQHFYVQIFHTNIIWAAFSSYILALAKNLYKKRAQKH